MPVVIATQALALKGRRRLALPGERVEVSERERVDLLRHRYARDAVAEEPAREGSAADAPEVPSPAPPRRRYKRRDLQAEST